MTPARLSALPPSRVSAGRALLDRMVAEQWRFERVFFDIDADSNGEALYRVRTGDRVFDFVVYSYAPDHNGRTGRITQRNWDMMAALIDGESTPEERARTRTELPKLYVGRSTRGTLTWSRSNRSFRAFDHAVSALAAGEQPDQRTLWQIGYLMRNTGLDGNGTFGTTSFLAIDDDHPLRHPLHAQLFTAYLMREYAADLVDAMAAHRAPEAARLSPDVRRMIGIGNGSALGLLFFVNTHPHLIGSWLHARQELILEASRIPLVPGGRDARLVLDLARSAADYYAADPYEYHTFEDPHAVGADLARAAERLAATLDAGATTGGELLVALDGEIGVEAWEVIAANLLELLPTKRIGTALTEGITPELMTSDPRMAIAELRGILDRDYAWAQAIDMDAPGARHYVWYKSADAEEPRRGPAAEVHGGRNWALDLPGEIQRLAIALDGRPQDEPVGLFLAARPDLRFIVERVQSLRALALHSPHMNMLDREFVPVSIVRFLNSAIHGLHRTVDTVDQRNVLGLIYLGAPTAAEITAGTAAIDPYPQAPAVNLEATR
jgi:hypothetical protein